MSPRPYVLVNVAMSADGKIDSVARRGAAISSAADKRRVDELRASVDAVLVGGRTLLQEDPKLTVRSPQLRLERRARGLDEQPAKVGVVSLAELDPAGDYMTAGPAVRLIYTTDCTPPEQAALLEAAGARVFYLGADKVDLHQVMASLYQQGIRRLMVEGGGTLIAELFSLGLVDELTIYVAPKLIGGASAPTLADGPGFLPDQAPCLDLVSAEPLDENGGVLLHYKVQIPRGTYT